MTTATLTLAEFLLARIDEDEAAVRAWDSDAKTVIGSVWTGERPGYSTVASRRSVTADEPWIADGREVVAPRHERILLDPARVLADCEAKRAIVEQWGPFETYRGDDLLVVLAQPYASHPDFRDEWRA